MTSPLHGMRVVNTRAIHQASTLDDALRAAGAVPLAYPCIAIRPPKELSALERHLSELSTGAWDWLLLTSVNTVTALANRGAIDPAALDRLQQFKVAAVGPATAEAARSQLGLRIDFVPEKHNAAALAITLPIESGERVLLPGSDIANPHLEQVLISRGAEVTTVTAYRTVTGTGGVDLPELLRTNKVDALTFASPSAVSGLLDRLKGEGLDIELISHLPVACVGSTTAAAARNHGFTRVITSADSTITSLVTALGSFATTSTQGASTWQ